MLDARDCVHLYSLFISAGSRPCLSTFPFVQQFETELSRLGASSDEVIALQNTLRELNAQKLMIQREQERTRAKMTSDYSDTDEDLKRLYETFVNQQAA